MQYNYFRDYDSGTGRYLEFDLIGLSGGLNGYLYANAAPTVYTDPLGLAPYNDPMNQIANRAAGLPPNANLPPQLPQPFSNGNYDPGSFPQDGLCTVPLVGGKMNSNSCVIGCCKVHDDCYARNGCNSSSWKGNLIGLSYACQQCNTEARQCVTRALLKPDTCTPSCEK